MITNEFLKTRYKQICMISSLITVALVAFAVWYVPNYYKKTIITKDIEPISATANTVRIYGKDYYETSVAITQIAYPATFKYDKPNAIILVRDDKQTDGILGAKITGSPINAPILYTKKDYIPEVTLREIERLDPQGVFVDKNIKVILIGDIGEKVKDKIKNKGWSYRYIPGDNPFELGKNIDEYLTTLSADHSNNVIIAGVQNSDSALVQTGWNAQTGDGFFFVKKDKIPIQIAKALKLRSGRAFIYLLGNQNDISTIVEKELSKFGHVQRIPNGKDIYSQSVGFAGYKDIGKDFAWWVGKRPRSFGWGITDAGHNFIFVNPRDWHCAVTASILSSKGKHGAILLINSDNIPQTVINYLETLKPSVSPNQGQANNHGWIIGSKLEISDKVQIQLDTLLESEGS